MNKPMATFLVALHRRYCRQRFVPFVTLGAWLFWLTAAGVLLSRWFSAH